MITNLVYWINDQSRVTDVFCLEGVRAHCLCDLYRVIHRTCSSSFLFNNDFIQITEVVCNTIKESPVVTQISVFNMSTFFFNRNI